MVVLLFNRSVAAKVIVGSIEQKDFLMTFRKVPSKNSFLEIRRQRQMLDSEALTESLKASNGAELATDKYKHRGRLRGGRQGQETGTAGNFIVS